MEAAREEAGEEPSDDLLILEDDFADESTNDEWAFEQADRLIESLPKSHGSLDRRTEGEVFDRRALLSLNKLLTHGILKSLDFPVSTGKEANVFRGTTPEGALVAVKIYRVNTATFRNIRPYIDGDERFKGVGRDKRTVVSVWAQKELRNLRRMHEAGVAVPEPIAVLNNILVMEYLGTQEGAYASLKELGRLQEPAPVWHTLCNDVVRIHNDAGLVHADLSPFNILAEPQQHGIRPRIIDAGQAVLTSHPRATEFLTRDLNNLSKYFHSQGVGDATAKAIWDRLEVQE